MWDGNSRGSPMRFYKNWNPAISMGSSHVFPAQLDNREVDYILNYLL